MMTLNPFASLPRQRSGVPAVDATMPSEQPTPPRVELEWLESSSPVHVVRITTRPEGKTAAKRKPVTGTYLVVQHAGYCTVKQFESEQRALPRRERVEEYTVQTSPAGLPLGCECRDSLVRDRLCKHRLACALINGITLV